MGGVEDRLDIRLFFATDMLSDVIRLCDNRGMTQPSDNGDRQTFDTVPGEVRINVRILGVDVAARTASAVIGRFNGGNPVDLTFAPEVPDDIGGLAGKRAWVEGPYKRGDNRLLSHIYVEYVEEGSNWMSSEEILSKSRPDGARPTKLSFNTFEFDVDEFLELIYVDNRGRSWAESKIN